MVWSSEQPVTGPVAVSPSDARRARWRRRWPVVLVIGLLAIAVVYLAPSLAGRQYMARSALELVSVGNTPDKETVLAQGYADFFDQPTTQDLLRARTGVPASVVLDARVAAASPILYVEATDSTPEAATAAVARITTAFRDEVERSLTHSSTVTGPAARSASKPPAPTTLSVLRLDAGTSVVPSGGLRAAQPYLIWTVALAALAVVLVPDLRFGNRTV